MLAVFHSFGCVCGLEFSEGSREPSTETNIRIEGGLYSNKRSSPRSGSALEASTTRAAPCPRPARRCTSSTSGDPIEPIELAGGSLSVLHLIGTSCLERPPHRDLECSVRDRAGGRTRDPRAGRAPGP
ncbi:hypothetical protein EVAR_18381_1 [Eumeta japonica]|uniref:Uncharacterized protein n=1 Tax=Eumeta variegata TaxID=151549 RepID=A0A4C1UTV8_EUMVA|nr:hypothetical protein EVAR_18381_1 [Eumeta japonica]